MPKHLLNIAAKCASISDVGRWFFTPNGVWAASFRREYCNYNKRKEKEITKATIEALNKGQELPAGVKVRDQVCVCVCVCVGGGHV